MSPYREPGVVAKSDDDNIALPMEERIGNRVFKSRMRGVRFHTVLVSPQAYFSMARRLGARVVDDDLTMPYFWLHTAGGSVAVAPDPDCPVDDFHPLTQNVSDVLTSAPYAQRSVSSADDG